ncbi:MAG TPA: hypothetical protein VFW44_11775 [Bryobacteraceae bacterium]|nr:hypothetical protein [Bryobacteraceae bacterium]
MDRLPGGGLLQIEVEFQAYTPASAVVVCQRGQDAFNFIGGKARIKRYRKIRTLSEHGLSRIVGEFFIGVVYEDSFRKKRMALRFEVKIVDSALHIFDADAGDTDTFSGLCGE